MSVRYEIQPVYVVFIPLSGFHVLFPFFAVLGCLTGCIETTSTDCFQSHVKPSVLIELSALIQNPAERLGGKFLDWDVTIPVGITRLLFPFFLRAQQMSACWHLEGMSSFSVSLLSSVLLSKHNVLKLSVWSSSCALYMIYLSGYLTLRMLCNQARACLLCSVEWLKPGWERNGLLQGPW